MLNESAKVASKSASQFYWTIIENLCLQLLETDVYIKSIKKNSSVLIALVHQNKKFHQLKNISGVTTYFKLIAALKNELKCLKSIIEAQEANYEQILDYYEIYEQLETIARSLDPDLIALDSSQLCAQKCAFQTCHTELSQLLIKGVTDNW